MPLPDHFWGTIHPSVYSQAAKMVRWAKATPRPNGALRYQCPVTGSLVLITDQPTLAHLTRARARLRCTGCGEMHLLAQDARPASPVSLSPLTLR